jgi:hypothetical protein
MLQRAQRSAISHQDGERIRFTAKDPDNVPHQSTTLDKTVIAGVRGWAVTDPAAPVEMNIPEGETVTEIPDRLVPFFREG